MGHEVNYRAVRTDRYVDRYTPITRERKPLLKYLRTKKKITAAFLSVVAAVAVVASTPAPAAAGSTPDCGTDRCYW